MIGTWLQQVATSWRVWRLSGPAALLGLVAFVGARVARREQMPDAITPRPSSWAGWLRIGGAWRPL